MPLTPVICQDMEHNDGFHDIIITTILAQKQNKTTILTSSPMMLTTISAQKQQQPEKSVTRMSESSQTEPQKQSS